MLGRPVTSYEAAFFGSISGGIAAAVTTPLDVIKTRLMLGKVSSWVYVCTVIAFIVYIVIVYSVYILTERVCVYNTCVYYAYSMSYV